MVRIWVASLHQKSSSVFSTLEFFVLLVRETHKCGWIRTASTRRTVRRVKKPLRGFFRCAARDIHPRPPRTPVSEPGTGVSVLSAVQKGRKGGFEQQQRRPLPAAETGRSCWGCGQQDTRAAQGTMQPLGAATRAPFLRGSRNPPAPTKNLSVCKYAEVFVFPGLSLSRKKHLHFRHVVL